MGAAASIAGIPRRVKRQANAIAVVPRLGLGLSSQHRNFGRRFHAATFQRFPQNRLLPGQLRCVVRVLIVAAAARAKVRAGGHNALRRGGDDLFRFGGRVAALVLRDPHPRLFAGQRERHKHRLAFHASQKCTAVDGLLDFDHLRFGGKRGFWPLHSSGRFSGGFAPCGTLA